MIEAEGRQADKPAAGVTYPQTGLGHDATYAGNPAVCPLSQGMYPIVLGRRGGKAKLIDIAPGPRYGLQQAGVEGRQGRMQRQRRKTDLRSASTGLEYMSKVLCQAIGNIEGGMGNARQRLSKYPRRLRPFERLAARPQQQLIGGQAALQQAQ